jgi:signal transduction histidine kinase
MMIRRPSRWWANQSLRARLTLTATALFSVAVASGAILLLLLQRYALVHTLDDSAAKTASDIAQQFTSGPRPVNVVPTTGGVLEVQVVDADDVPIAVCCGASHFVPLLTPEQLVHARNGRRYEIESVTSNAQLRVIAQTAGSDTVLVVTDLKSVNDSVRVLGEAALIGGPLAVLVMALATYFVVALTLRSVAGLRHGAAAITAAGLSDQRLPLPRAQDEIHRLAVTLNAMLDRIDAATQRQRTFVGDAAHELRSPLASLRVQLEVARRVGPEKDLPALVDDVLQDVDRLDRLVEDLLALARLTEAHGSLARIESVAVDQLIGSVVANYEHARVPVHIDALAPVRLNGDPDGLRRVAVNLIDNAVRFARTGVTVTVLADERSVTLLVTDDGRGIPPTERERVFDRFYRIQASRSRDSGGTGLGLSIVRELVQAHGGIVQLTGNPRGRGTQAVVVLPRQGGAAAPSSTPSAAATESLVVD